MNVISLSFSRKWICCFSFFYMNLDSEYLVLQFVCDPWGCDGCKTSRELYLKQFNMWTFLPRSRSFRKVYPICLRANRAFSKTAVGRGASRNHSNPNSLGLRYYWMFADYSEALENPGLVSVMAAGFLSSVRAASASAFCSEALRHSNYTFE